MNNKSIDDIMREASLAEFISSATADNTNVDVGNPTIKPSNIGTMDINTLMELLKMVEPMQQKDMSTYGGGSVGVVDSPDYANANENTRASTSRYFWSR